MPSIIERVQVFILNRGFYLARRYPDISVGQLLDLVWPIETNHELIRLGADERADGGYLVPDDLDGIHRVFSPGVADSMDFEMVFLDKGIPCELIDGSIERIPQPHPLARFEPLWLSGKSGPKKISLDDWVSARSQHDEELILQIDIEGAEYEAILSASISTLSRFRIIVIELHDLKAAFSRPGFILLQLLLAHLGVSHEIVHAHPNNCCLGVTEGDHVWPEVVELTYLRKDRIREELGPAQLPHPLDKDNTPNPTIRLKPYKGSAI